MRRRVRCEIPATNNGVTEAGFDEVRVTQFGCEACQPADPITAEVGGVTKSRYLSFVPPQLAEPTAIRVVLDDVNGFPGFTGDVRWLSPPAQHPEENVDIPGQTFWGARLACEPFYADWGSIGLVHVYGGALVPESLYSVQVIRAQCDQLVADEEVFSSSLVLEAGVWGDVVSPFASSGLAQPDFNDIAAVVSKFVQEPTAPIKASAQLQANTPKPDESISFKDVAAAVSGFIPEPYPYVGPCVCPSIVTCGVTACINDTECGDGICLGGFCTDPCGRCSP